MKFFKEVCSVVNDLKLAILAFIVGFGFFIASLITHQIIYLFNSDFFFLLAIIMVVNKRIDLVREMNSDLYHLVLVQADSLKRQGSVNVEVVKMFVGLDKQIKALKISKKAK